MRVIFLLIASIASSFVFAENLPLPVSAADSPPESTMVWNKWETDNFIILSIDYDSGLNLKSCVEDMKLDFCRSWGVQDRPLPVKCKIVVVPDPSILKKFFSLEFPRQEVRNESGKVREIAIWLDNSRRSELKSLIASVCLYDRAPFLRTGVPAIMSSSPSEISETILSIPDRPLVFFGSDDKSSEGVSVLSCLFFRKEFGLATFARIVADNGIAPEKICGFSDRNSLESSISRYCENLKSDLKSGKTPKSYLAP